MFSFCISLTVTDKMDRRQWGGLSVLSATLWTCERPVTASCPWAVLSLSLSICFDSCSHKLSHITPLAPSHHSISLSYLQLLYTQMCVQTHTNTQQQTRLCLCYLRWTPTSGATVLTGLNGPHCHADWHLPLRLISMDQRSHEPS